MNIQTHFHGQRAEVSFSIPVSLYHFLRAAAFAADILLVLGFIWLFAVFMFSLEG